MAPTKYIHTIQRLSYLLKTQIVPGNDPKRRALNASSRSGQRLVSNDRTPTFLVVRDGLQSAFPTSLFGFISFLGLAWKRQRVRGF
jgi:hypothetical protein